MKLINVMICSVLLAGPVAAIAQEAKPKAAQSQAQPKTRAETSAKAQDFKEIDWEVLVPKDWDPWKQFGDVNLDTLNDNDPRAMDLIEKMRRAWDDAPVNKDLNGMRIRIPGYIVPLDAQRGQMKEFLLVPYFGACIHTPPPPANQIIHGFAAKPLKEVEMMSAVWISGTLEIARSNTEFGVAGYRLNAVQLKPYTEEGRR